MADDVVDRPLKRRKVITNQIPEDLFTSRPEFQLKIASKHLTQLGLSNPVLISLEKVDYIQFNSDYASYLFYISSCIFEVPSKQINLYYSMNGGILTDESSSWETVEEDDKIAKGVYLLEFEDDARNPPCIFPPPTPILHHYSNLILVPNVNFLKVKSRPKSDTVAEQMSSKPSPSRISTPAQSMSVPATPTAPKPKSKNKGAIILPEKGERGTSIDDEKIKVTETKAKSTPSKFLVLLYSIPELISGPNTFFCRISR